ncbi:MAG: FtsW/RodA/SpoVE family cell cycle protein, partial [Deltaproteobacteria bacterium]|nr:FtsW/RodA/SpoVE family cell cycle protein [Deltaproteobacteria bacterium]
MADPKQKWFYYFHWPLLILVFLLLAVGMLNLRSAAPEGSDYWYKQWLWLGAGSLALGIGFSINRHLWERFAWPVYLCSLALLFAVVLFGYEAGGQRNWLKIGSFRFQPSELAKLGALLVLAKYFSKKPSLKRFKDLILPGIYGALPLFLLLAVGDFGGALFFIL